MTAAQGLDRQLRELAAGEAIACLVPFQAQDDRTAALDHFAGVVAELRAAGWQLETSIERKTDGEAFVIEPLAPPTTPTQPLHEGAPHDHEGE